MDCRLVRLYLLLTHLVDSVDADHLLSFFSRVFVVKERQKYLSDHLKEYVSL